MKKSLRVWANVLRRGLLMAIKVYLHWRECAFFRFLFIDLNPIWAGAYTHDIVCTRNDGQRWIHSANFNKYRVARKQIIHTLCILLLGILFFFRIARLLCLFDLLALRCAPFYPPNRLLLYIGGDVWSLCALEWLGFWKTTSVLE